MKNKYFTRQTGIKTIIYPAIPIFVCGLILLPKYPQLFWFIVGYATYVVIVTIVSFNFPVLSGSSLIIKNAIFRFIQIKYKYPNIKSVVVSFGAYQNLACKIRLRDRKFERLFSISSMGYESIRSFVEELRSKGVEVKCTPYKYKGKMIYL